MKRILNKASVGCQMGSLQKVYSSRSKRKRRRTSKAVEVSSEKVMPPRHAEALLRAILPFRQRGIYNLEF